MATITRDPAASHLAYAADELLTAPASLAPILVATDGTESADHAVRAAKAIAAHTGRRVEVIAVCPVMPTYAPEVQFVDIEGAAEESRVAMRARVEGQLARTGGDVRWPLDVVTGAPEIRITDAAHRLNAALVIMGLGEHGMMERLLGDEMVLRVTRLGTVPVLAVAPGFLGLPRRVLAATDFSPSSMRAAKLAESLLARRGQVTVAHVEGEGRASYWRELSAPLFGTIARAFTVATAEFRDDTSVRRQLLGGDPADAILDYARSWQADLIATGSHGFGFLTRLWLGSVSQRLVRGARCSILIAPPEDLPGYEQELTSTTRFSSYQWTEQLEEFTRRNAGRRATLELIDPEFGAQIETREVPLVGIDYDPEDVSIHVMLGTHDGRHVTRRINNVTGVQVLRTREGADFMLRIAHGAGQTLLSLEPLV